MEKEREGRRKEADRARQELETRKRIETRLKARKEAEIKARRESTENGGSGIVFSPGILDSDFVDQSMLVV